MRFVKTFLITVSSISLIILSACSNTNQTSSPENPLNNTASKPAQIAKNDAANKPGTPQKGGQVVESGAYHLEFVPEKEAKGTHLDFYLQKGDNHEAIPNAKVTAQIQLPDGTQKRLPLTYDAPGKHYAALLPETATGQYQVKVTSEVNGQKVDGRFSFNR